MLALLLYALGVVQMALSLWYVNAFQTWTDEDALIPWPFVVGLALCWIAIVPALACVAVAVWWKSKRESGFSWETRKKS